MKLSDFTFENFMPDGMTLDEVKQWNVFFLSPLPDFLPDVGLAEEEKTEQINLMAEYCRIKLSAMINRIDGNIQRAMNCEASCDFVYQKIDSRLRW